MPDHLADKLQMRYPPRTARCKQEKQCQGFKNTSGTNVKVKKKKKKKWWNKQGVAARGGWYYKGNLSVPSQSGGSWMPPSEEDSTSCRPLYFCYMTQFSQPSQATLRSPVRRCKNNHPRFRLVLISLLSWEATWDKAQASLDTSNQWNPQGLRWVFNEVHYSQLESPSPRNGLTFRLLFVFVLSLGSLQLVHAITKLPIRRSICQPAARATAASHSIMKQRSIISL